MKSSEELNGSQWALLFKPQPLLDWLNVANPVIDNLEVEVLRVRVPFHLHPVVESLPEENGKLVFSIREDQGFTIEKHPHEQMGWTVESQALEKADWCDAWITATVYQDRLLKKPRRQGISHDPVYVERCPAVNLSLEEAMRLGKELVYKQRRDEKTRTERTMGIVRIRHQHSGNVIYADLFHSS